MGWKRKPDFHLLLFVRGYHLGCTWTKPHCSFCVAALQVFSLCQGFKIIQRRLFSSLNLSTLSWTFIWGVWWSSWLFEQKKQRWREMAKSRLLSGGFPVLMKALSWPVPQVSVQEFHWQWELCRQRYRPWMEFLWCPVKSLRFNLAWLVEMVRHEPILRHCLSCWALHLGELLSRVVQSWWRTDLFLCNKKCWPQSGTEVIIQFSAAVQYCCFGISLCYLCFLKYWFCVFNFSSPVCLLDGQLCPSSLF